MTMGDRVAVLKDGILQQCDTPRALFESPTNAFVAGFIGSPAMNLIEGMIGEAGVAVGSTIIPVARELRERAAAADALSVIIGFRPESLEIVAEGQGFTAIVLQVEQLGSESYVYAQFAERADRSLTATSDVIIKTEPHFEPTSGELINLRVKEGAMLLFDAASGIRLR
jgi:multiple sugar transport system ATP-binding protein